MDGKERYLYVLLILCTLLCCHAVSTLQNACGGTAILLNKPMSWCDPGEHASSSSDCRLGVFHCAGPNTVVCMPIDCPESNRYQSSFVANKHSDTPPSLPPPSVSLVPTRKTCSLSCGERGRCDQTLGSCVCDKGWAGEQCERFEDPCSSPFAKCGDHGTCYVKKEGEYQCNCDEGWTGVACNIQTQCLPNGLWVAASKKCVCFEGWEGPSCSSCNSDFLCTPTKNRDNPFSLAYVPKDSQKDFLRADLGTSYAASHPIRPNSVYEDVLYDCSCKAAAREDEPLQENLIYYDELTGSFYIQHDPYSYPSHDSLYHSSYTHDYYSHYHYSPTTFGFFSSTITILFGFILLWMFCCCRCRYTVPRKKESAPKRFEASSSPLPPPLPPSPPLEPLPSIFVSPTNNQYVPFAQIEANKVTDESETDDPDDFHLQF